MNENSSLPPRNVAGHKAFHLWKSGVGRDTYIETVEDNLDFTSEDFRNYQSAVANALFGEKADLTNDTQMARLREELYAYISGDIHEGTSERSPAPHVPGLRRSAGSVVTAGGGEPGQDSERQIFFER